MELCKEFTLEPINLDGLTTLHQYTPRVETNPLHVVFQNPMCNSVVELPRSQSYAQLFVACSTVKRGGPGTFPHVSEVKSIKG